MSTVSADIIIIIRFSFCHNLIYVIHMHRSLKENERENHYATFDFRNVWWTALMYIFPALSLLFHDNKSMFYNQVLKTDSVMELVTLHI